ncbi:hypothetical protein [Muriicola marianensis]|uniref:hypothetical protein n=1 Tax=Muriicola marianensis TaxID=1324801 RepID=UPI001E40BF3A|nr:hypothetical protein [Muriicola marianensis]
MDNADGTYTYTDETGATQTIDTNASSNPYDNTASGLVATDVQAAIDEINALAGTVAMVDNGDGTYTFTDAAGNNTTISDTSISTLVDNADGTYTYTDETGATQTIDTNASSNPYDNTASGLVATDVQAAIDEINALAGTVAMVDNGDGTYTFTDAAGNNTTISDTSISTLVNNGDATFTYTDETGTPITIDLISADANNDIIAGSDGGLYLNVASVAVGETITNIADNGDGTFTYTNENGTPQTISKSDVTDNGDGTYTFDNNDGTPVTISTTAATNPYDNTVSGLTATDVQSAIDEVAAGSTDDQNLTLAANTLSIEDGNSVDLTPYLDNTDDQNISGSSLVGTNLTIGIENGASEIVDLSSLVGTDDQNISGSSLVGTNLTIGIENGASEIVDLSSLVGTDDQTAAEVTYDNTTSGLTATDVQAAIDEVAAGSTDDQNLTLAANTLSIEDGNSVDLSSYLDNTDDQNISGSSLVGTNLTIGIENGASEIVDLSSLVGTDDQNISGSSLVGTNLTIGIENGTSEIVDLSSLVGTDDQNLTLAANTLSIEDGNSVDLSPYLDNTDDQNLTGASLSGANILQIDIENGTSTTVDLSSLVGTDDQTAAEVTYDNTTSGLTATDVQGAIDEVVAGSSDDQNISGSGLAGTNLTIGIENGASEIVDLSSLVGTDDQTLSTDNTPGNISIEDGNSITLNVDDADADATNEYNTGVGMNAGALEVTDGGGTLSTGLISSDANNDIIPGSDGALYLNVASVAIAETITNIADNGDGTFTYTNENGVPQTISKADVTDNGDGTYTFDNNDGSPVTISTTAATNPYDNTTSGLTATDVQAAIDEVAAGSTDDQNISGSSLVGTNLTIGIENGASEVVDLSSLVGTDDQNIANLAIDTGTNILTVGIEDGTSQTVDLSHLDDPGTDDQTAAEVTYDNTTSGLTATDVQAAIDEVAAGSTDDQNLTLAANTLSIEDGNSVDLTPYLDNTDDQNISGSSLVGTNLTIGIENGASEVVDLSSLVGTDDQNISGSSLVGTNLTIGIENGTSEVVDLSSLVGTDDQNLTLAANTLSIEDGNSVDLTPYLDNTDDQNISGSSLVGTNLTIGIENGTSEVVDLSSLVGTDDQNIQSLAVDTGTNILTVGIENGASQTVDLSHLDDPGTDDQTAAEVSYDNTTSGLTATDVQAAIDEVAAGSTDDQNLTLAANTLSIEDGNSVDLTPYLDNTDDQNISGSSLVGTNLTIAIENGASEVVDLSSLVGTDDQNLTLAANTLSIEDGNSVDLTPYLDNTDDQNISGSSLVGTNLTIGIENGASEVVDLSSLVGTDDQNISGSSLVGTNLTIAIENGASEVVDLSSLVGTDDQNISGSSLVGTNLTIGIENGTSEVVDLSSLVGTDDQNLTLAANTLSIEDGNSVDLSSYLDNTDDQNIANLAIDTGTNILTVGIEDGTSQTVDLSHLDDAGTDDQTAAEVTYDNTTSGLTATDVQAAIDEVAAGSTDDQNLTLAANTLSIEDGNSVDLSPYLDNTDDQNISGSSLVGTNLTIGIENGASEVVDLSSLVGTDDQNISGSSLVGTNLTIGIENGTSEVVDLSSLVGTDDQNLTLAANTLSIEDGNSVDLTPYLDNTDDQNISGSSLVGTNLTIGIENGASEVVDLSSLVGTDDQNISGSSLVGTNLTIGIENGTSEVVDLSSLVGTDDQTAAEVSYDNTASGLTATDVQAAIDEVAAGSTDDQNLTLAANTLSIEDGNSVDLTPYLDNTDDQNIQSLAVDTGTNILTVGIENGASQTVDLSHLDDAGTDDQTAAEVSYDNTTSGLTATDVQAAIDEVAAGSTDDQNLTLAANTLSIEDGNSVDLTPYLDNTDDQNISGSSLVGTNLTIGIENGASEVVDLSSLVGTDDQNISGSSLVGTNLTIGIENGTSEVVDLSSLVGTDDQNIQSLAVDTGTNILTVGIENGASQTVDLSHLDDPGTDDQTAAEVSYDNTTSGLTATDVQAAIDEVAAGSTDDQNLTLAANTLSIEDGNSVDLTPYLDNTDDQNISGSSLVGTNLTIGIENGASEVVDLSSLVGTDDQNISGSSLVGTNLTIGIENGTSEVVDLSSLVGTDDQNISGSSLVGTNLTIGIENGTSEVVDLSSLVGTDDQNIANLAIDTGTNILTVGIEDGTSQTVDLSHLDDPGTDDQTAVEVSYDNTTSGLTATDVQAAIDEVAAGSTDDQYDDEVPLRTPIDVDEGGEASPTAETNVQEVINAIAPITSKAARIFYPPSIAIDASTNGVGFTEDLYAQYISQFGTPAVASTGAPAALPTYAATELYYYVTYADPTVFANMSIDANGVLTYDIIGQPSDYNSLINVVFVVK